MIFKFLAKIQKILLFWFVYQPCVNCGKKHNNSTYYSICNHCEEKITFIGNDSERCPICFDSWFDGTICKNCQTLTPNWKSLNILFSYQDCTIKNLIYQYKFLNYLTAEKDISSLIYKYKHLFQNRKIIIAPCSKKTKKLLGFNPVARILDNLNIPYYDILEKKKDSKIQKKLSAEERKNQLNPIILKYNIPPELFESDILIVDDVFTTGTTIKNIIDLLKSYGFENMNAFCFFRN